MKSQDISTARDKDLRSSLAALQRAAQAARQLAIDTRTAIVVQRGAVTLRITADELRNRPAK